MAETSARVGDSQIRVFYIKKTLWSKYVDGYDTRIPGGYTEEEFKELLIEWPDLKKDYHTMIVSMHITGVV